MAPNIEKTNIYEVTEHMSRHSKISIIGAGTVGATAAFSIATQRLVSELAIIDINTAKAEGEAMDISHGLITMGTMNIHSGTYEDVKDSDIIVVAAGLGRKPGETRLDLAAKNIGIARDIAQNIMKYYNGGVIIVVSNPVDVLTYVIQKETGLPAGKVMGTGTMLDSARFRYLLSTSLSADIRNIHGFMAGEHGESQFAVWSSVHVSSMPLDNYCFKRGISLNKSELVTNIIGSGAQVIKRKGMTNFAIAAIVAELCGTIMRDRGSILTVTSCLDNYYGISDVCISVPCIIGKEGILDHLPYDFNEEEMAKLKKSAESIRSFMDSLNV